MPSWVCQKGGHAICTALQTPILKSALRHLCGEGLRAVRVACGRSPCDRLLTRSPEFALPLHTHFGRRTCASAQSHLCLMFQQAGSVALGFVGAVRQPLPTLSQVRHLGGQDEQQAPAYSKPRRQVPLVQCSRSRQLICRYDRSARMLLSRPSAPVPACLATYDSETVLCGPALLEERGRRFS